MAASVLWRGSSSLCRCVRASSGGAALSALLPGGRLLPLAHYNPPRLRLDLQSPYIPDKDSEKTPCWQKTAKYDRKLFGRLGSKSGVDPASLWPTHQELDRMIADEAQWHPTLEQMEKNIQAREREEAAKLRLKKKTIAENMAKMPKMIADWRQQKLEVKLKAKEEKQRKARLMAEARSRFGTTLDPRSPKFLEMVAELEKEEKKKSKQLKRQQRLEALAGASAAAPPST